MGNWELVMLCYRQLPITNYLLMLGSTAFHPTYNFYLIGDRNMVTKTQIVAWLEAIAATIAENKDYLTQLDAAIGDGDHGTNLNRGFQKVKAQLPQVADKDIGQILKTASMNLISTVGGASGPLYGTLFLRASSAVGAKEELSNEDLVAFFEGAVAGVVQRGKAKLEDKTMLDALMPASDAFGEAIASGDDTIAALEKAVAAAETGRENTIPLVAKKGRASYLGDRSVGHPDPGATSTCLILKALLETIK